MTSLAARRVSPFGHPGITAHVQLPQAYRSLARPSSPLDAKASTGCLILFDLQSFGAHRDNYSCGFLPTSSEPSIVKERESVVNGRGWSAGDTRELSRGAVARPATR